LLINGVGGGVGVMAAQLARNRGAAVFGVGSQTKRSMTESLGATLVPYDSGDVVEQMRELLPGGVDAILDVVGGEAMRHVAILITNPARILSVADPSVAQLGGSFLRSSRAGFPPSPTWSLRAKSIPRCSRPTLSTKRHRHCEQWNPVTLSARS
jgi:NADPH:quinone reductase-like Zn-dependent oxidoreductase